MRKFQNWYLLTSKFKKIIFTSWCQSQILPAILQRAILSGKPNFQTWTFKCSLRIKDSKEKRESLNEGQARNFYISFYKGGYRISVITTLGFCFSKWFLVGFNSNLTKIWPCFTLFWPKSWFWTRIVIDFSAGGILLKIGVQMMPIQWSFMMRWIIFGLNNGIS